MGHSTVDSSKCAVQLLSGSLNRADLSREWQPGQLLAPGNRCRQVQMKHIQTLTARFLIMSIKGMNRCLGFRAHARPLTLLSVKRCVFHEIHSTILSSLINAMYQPDEIANSYTSHTKKHSFEQHDGIWLKWRSRRQEASWEDTRTSSEITVAQSTGKMAVSVHTQDWKGPQKDSENSIIEIARENS